MRNRYTYVLLLCAALLLTGFSWGFGSDSCQDAREMADSLDTIKDDALLRQAEAKILSLCPDGAPGRYVTALQLERVGNVDGAITEYRKALQSGSFPLASGNLGLLYAQKGMNDEAQLELARGIASSPLPKYHKAMARILAERKVYPLAIYHFNEAARGISQDAELFSGLAGAYAATGQNDRALEEYRRALAIDPNAIAAHIGIAAIHGDRNETDKAIESLKKAEAGSPQNRDIHLQLGSLYEKKGDMAAAEYQYLLGGRPKSLKTPAAQKPSGAIILSGDPAKDIEVIQAALKENPASVALHEKLGNLYRAAGREADAIAAYREAAHRSSTSPDLYLNLGILFEKHSQPDEAVVAYKQAIRVKPDSADAHLRLAEINNGRGLIQDAVTHYSEFLKLRPDSPDIQLKLARIFAKSKETGLAIDTYTAFLKHSPDNIDANREIAALHRSRGNNEKAVEFYTKVLSLQKDDMETRNALVSMYVKNKQYNEIAELLKGTAELFPDDPGNHYKLGLIYEFKKEYDNATAAYKTALEHKADHARSLNALGRLYMKVGKINEAKEMLEAAKKADPGMEETTVLLNNIRDEFNPEPRKISKGKGKSKKSRKSVKSKTAKTKNSADKKPAARKKSP